MKRVLLILLVAVLSIQVFAQTKSQRRIYLWDVTLSMQGYQGKTPDIYDDVVDFLVRDISSITDENTEIVVLPFQETILESWVVKATQAGKDEVIELIKGCKKDFNIPTRTDICTPFIDAKEKYIRKDKRNFLFLLTDGKHTNLSKHSKSDLIELLENWCDFSENKDAYALYVMLTKAAIDDELIEVIKKCERMEAVTEGIVFTAVDFYPTKHVKFNIKDDEGKPVKIDLGYHQARELPENIEIKVSTDDNLYIDVNQTVIVKGGQIFIDVDFKQPYNTLKSTLREHTVLPIYLELINKEAIFIQTGNKLLLGHNRINLELINKPEKTLRIHVK